MERVFGLDLLRAIAILMVLLAHSRLLLPHRYAWGGQLSIFGQLGVELFFVLSGFLIGGIVLKTFPDAPSGGSLLRFWTRRWFRTLPNYYLFLALNVGLYWVRGLPLPDVGAYGLFLQNLTREGPRFFAESWSLATEEWFYLLFPVLVLAAARIRPRLREASLLALSAVFSLSLAARLLALGSPGVSWDDLSKGVVFRLDAPMAGVLGAWLKAGWPQAWERARVGSALLGVPLLGVSSALLLHAGLPLAVRSLALTGCSLGVLACLPALDAWRAAQGAFASCVRRISLWSYSLYLCHLPVLTLLTRLLGPTLRRSLAAPPRAVLMVLAFFAASLAVAAINYRFFERPTTALRDRWS